VFFEKTLVFSHPLQLRFGYSLCIVTAMDKPSKRRLAKNTLSSKETWNPSRTENCPSSIPGFLFNLHLLQRKASPLSRFSPLLRQPSTGRPTSSRKVSTPTRGTIMGCAMGIIKPPALTAHWSTTRKRMPGLISGITGIANQRRRLGTWVRTRPPFQTPAHEAEAFVRPSTTRRERARHLRRSIASSASWSDNRRHLIPLRRRIRRSYTHLSARVSFIYLFH
jgi:hypothetical protein